MTHALTSTSHSKCYSNSAHFPDLKAGSATIIVAQNISGVGMSGSLAAKVDDMGVVGEQTENR